MDKSFKRVTELCRTQQMYHGIHVKGGTLEREREQILRNSLCCVNLSYKIIPICVLSIIYMCVCVHVYKCTCTYIHAHMHVYMHTYTRLYTKPVWRYHQKSPFEWDEWYLLRKFHFSPCLWLSLGIILTAINLNILVLLIKYALYFFYKNTSFEMIIHRVMVGENRNKFFSASWSCLIKP